LGWLGFLTYMSLWEYKVITSGKGGFATPALLEKFLNDLGREEWEIVEFRSSPDNPLAFTGLARRSTQRDWTLEDAAAAAAKAEAEKLRAEFAAKFQAATSNGPAAEAPQAASFLDEKVSPDDGYRKPIDTSRDNDPDAPEDEEKDEWDKLAEEDELPTFFDALKPHMRRNQRGPGMSVGTDYLAKKWGLDESDIKGALVECGLQIPADENAKPVYVEYDGDLYWVNINRRGEVWINTREKPRPVFRVVQAQKVAPETPEEQKTETTRPERADTAEGQSELPAGEGGEGQAQASKPENGGRGLPEGPALLQRIRPHMRRNRRGPGGSGSLSFLARAVRTTEAELVKRFTAMGMAVPATHSDPATQVVIGDEVWWLNKDGRGNLWINGREKRDRDTAAAAPADAAPSAAEATAEKPAEAPGSAPIETAPAAPATENGAATEAAPTEAVPSEPTAVSAEPAAAPTEQAPGEAPVATTPEPANVLAAVRLLLKETRTGGFAGKVERVAEDLQRSTEDLTTALVAAGLKVPEKAREKPVFVEHGGEIFWFNRNAKGELWVNAKASKFADKGGSSESASGKTDASADAGEKKRRPRARGRGRSAKSEPAGGAESGSAGEASESGGENAGG